MTPNPIVDEERVARLVPLDAIDPDPDQPRKTFPGDALQELAQRIWEQGLIQPITASSGEDGRFKIFTGERRWRAFQINRERAARFFAGNPEDLPEDHLALRYGRWTSIPLLEAPALTPSDRILLQVAENHDRADLTLYERAVAIYKSFQLSGLKGKDFAVKAGIPAGVLSAYKGLAQSSGLTKLALENGVLQDPKVEPEGSAGLPEGPFLLVDGLLWLQTHLEGCEPAGEEEPLRLEAVEATRKAVLTSAPFILIRESLGEPRSPLESPANRKLAEAV